MDLRKTIEKEAQKQIDALAKMESAMGKDAVRLQQELYKLLVEKYVSSLATDSSGKILFNAANIARANDISKVWSEFQRKQYQPFVMDFAKDLLSIVDIESGYFLAIGKEFDIAMNFSKTAELISKQLGIDPVTGKIIDDSYLYRLLDGSQVKDNVTNFVLQNVSAKSSFADLREGLGTLIKGDETVNGEMQRYLRAYAYDTFAQTQRAVDLNIADTYGFNSFVYSGDIIKDTREFCAERAGGVFSREELEEWQTLDWQGKNPDVPVEISLGGYNCRHTLMWIPDEAKDKMGDEKIKMNKPDDDDEVVGTIYDIEKTYPTDKEELIKFLNKKHEQNYEIDNKGKIYNKFMGKKMYYKPDELRRKWINFERASIVRSNNRMVRDYLNDNGYELVSANRDATSTYYHKKGIGVIRLSDHSNTSSMYIEPTLNAYSEAPNGYINLIKEIKELEKLK